MPNFTLKQIEAIRGKQEFYQLVIDGKGQLDIFESILEAKYKSEFKSLLVYMEFIANNCTLPNTKFREITPTKEKVKEYEFKSKHLRIYAIQKMNGKIIILGGYKNAQKKDIKRFRALKKQYLNT